MLRNSLAWFLVVGTWAPFAHAETVHVRIERAVEGANRPALTPMWIALHDGKFDFFDAGQVATNELRAIAELGEHDSLRSLFADHGVDGVAGQMPLTQDNPVAQATLEVDSSTHRFLSFAAMVLPSNDIFYGNDDPRQFEVFDSDGRFSPVELLLTKSAWWDAGSEINNKSPSGGAAFILGADPADGVDSRGTVTPFAELSFYNGATLVNGERFETLPQATEEFEPMVRITIVPEPSSPTFLVLTILLCVAYSRRPQ